MNILVHNRLRSTPVYDVYWYFASERQNVFFNRLLGLAEPWTVDPIITKYKFTNSFRVIDRTSQFLISHIINPDVDSKRPLEDRIFRILLFKLFNKIETWQLIVESLHDISWSQYSHESYDEVLTGALRKGLSIYSAAYIMAPGRKPFGNPRKHQNHLELLELMMKNRIAQQIVACKSMAQLYDVLLSYPLIGTFLAYQFATDINYGDITGFSEEEFVVAGPGARDGIMKCFDDRGKYTDEDIIRYMMDKQEDEFRRLNLKFETLFGRSLKLIDCQNLFCEVGKYARVSHPHISDKSGRFKIKQMYRTTGALPFPSFPRKWNLSCAVSNFMDHHSSNNEAWSMQRGGK